MHDLTNAAQPTVAIAMVGDIPIPIDPPPIPVPPLPTPAIPHVGNPFPYVVRHAEAAWSDVAGWVDDGVHAVFHAFTGAASLAATDIESIVQSALHIEQEAWSTFVNVLEGWINASVNELTDTLDHLAAYAATSIYLLYNELLATASSILGYALEQVAGIDQSLARQWWDTVQAIDNAEADIRAWAIDNIAHPLLNDLRVSIDATNSVVGEAVATLEGEIADLKAGDIAKALAGLGVIAAAVTAVESWVNDCGEPMCEQMGPKTDFSKLVKALNIAGMLALVSTFGTLTESDLESLAATVVGLGVDPAETLARLFVTDGDTLAVAIGQTLPALIP